MRGQPVRPHVGYGIDCAVRRIGNQVSGWDVNIVCIGAWPSIPLLASDTHTGPKRLQYVTYLHNSKL